MERSDGGRSRYVCVVFRSRTVADIHALARRLLKSLSIKQGLKYDAPESVRDIPPFIEFHNLNTEEILDPLDSFSAFAISSHAQPLTFLSRNIQRVLLPQTQARRPPRREPRRPLPPRLRRRLPAHGL